MLAEASATTSKSSFETDSCEVSIEQKRKNIPSVSTALLLGGVLGLLETLLLVLSAKPILGYMGVTPVTFSLFIFFIPFYLLMFSSLFHRKKTLPFLFPIEDTDIVIAN